MVLIRTAFPVRMSNPYWYFCTFGWEVSNPPSVTTGYAYGHRRTIRGTKTGREYPSRVSGVFPHLCGCGTGNDLESSSGWQQRLRQPAVVRVQWLEPGAVARLRLDRCGTPRRLAR